MSDFWNNIVRYPRFFISSMLGLIVVILSTFKSLFNIKQFGYLFPILLILLSVLLFKILTIMTGL